MEFINNHPQLLRAVTMYAYTGVDGSSMSVEQKAKLLYHASTGMPGDIICNTGEYLYAHYDLLDEAGTELTAQIFAFSSRSGWAESAGDDRYSKIVAFIINEKGMTTVIPYIDEAPPAPKIKMRNEELDWRIEEGIIEPEIPPTPLPPLGIIQPDGAPLEPEEAEILATRDADRG